MPEFEKETPPDGFNTPFRFGPPRKLKTPTDVTLRAAYEPADVRKLLEVQTEGAQTITFHFEEPWFLMSGVGMLRKVMAPPIVMNLPRGYLSSFRPSNLSGGAQPEATITITITEGPDAKT